MYVFLKEHYYDRLILVLSYQHWFAIMCPPIFCNMPSITNELLWGDLSLSSHEVYWYYILSFDP